MSRIRLKTIAGGSQDVSELNNTRLAYSTEWSKLRDAKERFDKNPKNREAVDFNESRWEHNQNSDVRPLKYIGAKKKGGPGAAS